MVAYKEIWARNAHAKEIWPKITLHSKPYNLIYAASEDADQPALPWHPRSLTRVTSLSAGRSNRSLATYWVWGRFWLIAWMHRHIWIYESICANGYGKYQNPKIKKDGILIYRCVCISACYSNTLKSYAAWRIRRDRNRAYGFLALST